MTYTMSTDIEGSAGACAPVPGVRLSLATRRRPTLMRALVFERFGGPDVLEIRELPVPSPGPGEVVLQVTAAGLNGFDHEIRHDRAGFPIPLPFVGGMEAVGIVHAVGDGVTGWRTGDRALRDIVDPCRRCRYCRSGREWRCVDGATTFGSLSGAFAEFLVCRAERLVGLPDAIDDVRAAAVQLSYGTAWHMLHARARVESGDVVLIGSVGSALGAAAADIARIAGATVIGTASTDERLAVAAGRGVSHVVDARTTDVREAVMDLTDGEGVDVAIDHVGGDAFREAYDCLAMDGRLVTCGRGGGAAVVDLQDLREGRKEIIGSVSRTLEDLHRCLDLVAAGRLDPAVAATVPLDRAADAFRLADRQTAFGKIVIRPSASADGPVSK